MTTDAGGGITAQTKQGGAMLQKGGKNDHYTGNRLAEGLRAKSG